MDSRCVEFVLHRQYMCGVRYTESTCVECVLHGKYMCGVCITRKVHVWNVHCTDNDDTHCAVFYTNKISRRKDSVSTRFTDCI